jgi:hypothetical protein
MTTGELDAFRLRSGIIEPDQRPVGPFSVNETLSDGGSLSARGLPFIFPVFVRID